MYKVLFLIIAISLSISAQAYEDRAYKRPVNTYHYVKNVESLLTSAVSRDNWTLVKQENGSFGAKISHKSYLINVSFIEGDGTIALHLDSVNRVDCGKSCKVDQEQVDYWLLRLRRSIAVELTLIVKKAAMKEYLLTEE